MEDFARMECGCYVGFNVRHKPMWGKQCPLHKSSPDLYEALRLILKEGLKDYTRWNAKQAIAKAEGKT